MKKLINGADSSLYPNQLVDAVIGQSALQPKIVTDTTLTITFPEYGDTAFLLQFNQDCKITALLSSNTLQYQRVTLIINQSFEGNALVTFDDSIKWDGGKQPFISMVSKAQTIIELVTFNGQLRGRRIYGGY